MSEFDKLAGDAEKYGEQAVENKVGMGQQDQGGQDQGGDQSQYGQQDQGQDQGQQGY
ncbi:MAG: hypothetical protein ABSA53_08100 [Streptosporangiaceae bacterium]